MIRLPAEFVSSMKEMMGEEELAAFLSCYEEPEEATNSDGIISDGVAGEAYDHASLPRALRINPLKAGRSEVPDLSGFGLKPVPWAVPYGFYYGIGRADVRPGKSPLHDAGLYYMQEPSAMAPAALSQLTVQALWPKIVGDPCPEEPCSGAALDISRAGKSCGTAPPEVPCPEKPTCGAGGVPARPGERVLDLCAAPGGKTTMLASMLGGEGLLVSNEIELDRARILSQNVERMGIVNAVVTNESPARLAERFPAFFDRVLVDAPCSGEGMFRKEEQAVTTWSPEKVTRCAQLQAQILGSAAGMVRSGGILVYSTCTFAPEEDERQAVSFLQSHPEFELVDLPALLGPERMWEYGFEPGRPEWVEVPETEVDLCAGKEPEWSESSKKAFSKKQGDIPGTDPALLDAEGTAHVSDLSGGDAAQARRTIRLWPHRLRGEGHFVAVFRRAGEHVAEPIPQGRGLDALYVGSGRGVKNAVKESGESADPSRPLRFSPAEVSSENVIGRRRTRKDSGKGSGKPARGAGRGQSLTREEWTSIRRFINEDLTVDIAARCAASCGADAVRFGDEIYLMPYAAQIPSVGLKILRPGLHLGTLKKGRFEPAHALAMALRPEEAVRCVNLRSSCSGKQSGPAWGLSEDTEEDAEGRNLPGESPKAARRTVKIPGENPGDARRTVNLPGESPEAAAFLRGESLPCDPRRKGWTLVSFDGISAGWGKASGGMLKNHYPKGLRRGH